MGELIFSACFPFHFKIEKNFQFSRINEPQWERANDRLVAGGRIFLRSLWEKYCLLMEPRIRSGGRFFGDWKIFSKELRADRSGSMTSTFESVRVDVFLVVN